MFKIVKGVTALFIIPSILIMMHVFYNETMLHKVSTDLKYGSFSKLFLFPTWEIAIIYGGLLLYFTKINMKNPQNSDKYMARGYVFLALGLIMGAIGLISHGWLLDYVARLLRFGSFIVSIYVMSCGASVLSVSYKNKK